MTRDSDLFSGKSVLVTGAGRGLGREIALAVARAGADVAGTARTRVQIEDTIAGIEVLGCRGLALVADVTQELQVRTMVEQALAEFGQIDILVNNAGVAEYGPFVEQEAADWRAMIDTNLMGTLYCTHALLPSMLDRSQGLVINIASVAGIHGLPNEAVYCASKHGVKAAAHTAIAHDPTTEVDDALMRAIDETGADLVVMASHVPNVMDHIWPSNGGKLAEHAKCSVMVVRA